VIPYIPERHHAARFPVYASAPSFAQTTDEAKERIRRVDNVDKKRTVATVNGTTIDYSWLKGASETYQISSDINDFVITEVPIVTIGYPNRNLHCFPFSEASYFDPRFGTFVYKTFVGKPAFADHCFPAGTQISVKGGLREIQDIKVGDAVYTDKLRLQKVTEVFKNGKRFLTTVLFGENQTIEATSNHPFGIKDGDGIVFFPVEDLRAGDLLAVLIGDEIEFLPITDILRNVREDDVYNFEVEEDHTYIAEGVVVHNCNKNFVEAKGIHFDSSLRYVPAWDVWKIYVLLGYDRTKDSALARQIEKGQRRSYSMGAWVSVFLNSLTGQLSNGTQPLKYPKGSTHNGILSYDNCCGVEFFETSSVESPADVSAESHQLWCF